jgi:Uma2 family endonuclease
MKATAIVPLESGDRLTREEFHRRYCAHPELRAELVEGVVYVSSPVSLEHADPHAAMVAWLKTYSSRAHGLTVADNVTVLLPGDSEVQPDACLFHAGAVSRSAGQRYLEGAPELVVEIAASSASYDLHDKKEAYRHAGVREYIVWRVFDEAIDWFRLRGDQYVEVRPDASGLIESEAFPGLRLHLAKMLADDFAGVVAELRAPGERPGESGATS